MSNISVNTITDASGGSTASINGLTPQASNMQPYNMVINGAMTISQRGTSFTGLTNGGTDYTLDRWKWVEGGTPSYVMSVEQSSDAPAGFSNSLKTTTTTGSAIAVNDICRLFHWMEGNTTPHLAWGTATAKPLTVSFWIKSSVTGNYSVALYFVNSTARLITSTYTINTANTWEYKTITFLGDTGLAPVTDNGQGLLLQFGLISGTDFIANDSTSWADYDSTGFMYGQTAQLNTTNDTWQITGVQLEAGSTASSFAYENVGDTLRKCERYYQKVPPLVGHGNSTNFWGAVAFRTEMRAQPAISLPSNSLRWTDGYASDYPSTNANPSWVDYSAHSGGRFGTSNHSAVSADARRGTMMLQTPTTLNCDAEL